MHHAVEEAAPPADTQLHITVEAHVDMAPRPIPAAADKDDSMLQCSQLAVRVRVFFESSPKAANTLVHGLVLKARERCPYVSNFIPEERLTISVITPNCMWRLDQTPLNT